LLFYGWQRTGKFGDGGLNGPRPHLGCSAIRQKEKAEEEEE
jgi:hypothetical protein